MNGKRKNVIWVCDICGSADVKKDAYASFDVETQQWELHSIYNAAYCDKCGSEASISEHVLSPIEYRRIVDGDDVAKVLGVRAVE